MKDGAQEILGKTISGVVIKTGNTPPVSQLFLLFEDGTYFEFYCAIDHIQPTGGIWPGRIAEVKKYMGDIKEVTFFTQPKVDM